MNRRKVSLPFDQHFIGLISNIIKPTIVVSIFGKSTLRSKSCKASFVNDFYDLPIFNKSTVEINLNKNLESIDCFYDELGGIVYLHLTGAFDSHLIVQNIEQFSTEIEEKGFLRVWSAMKYNYARSVFYLFSVSHIVLLSHPVPVFDISYLNFFKSIDRFRPRILQAMQKALSKIPDVTRGWKTNARMCLPRLLFYYETCPHEFKKITRTNGPCHPSLKKSQHSLENQIYSLLKGKRILSKDYTKLLFDVPAYQEFVLIEDSFDQAFDWNEFLSNSMVTRCNSLSTEVEECLTELNLEDSQCENMFLKCHNIKNFLFNHINVGLTSGFRDTAAKLQSKYFFEAPKIGTWCQVANRLYDLIVLTKDLDDKSKFAMESLRLSFDTDTNFSRLLCQKAQSLALAVYRNRLPLRYNKQFHEKRVGKAFEMFYQYARGPQLLSYAQGLVENLEYIWMTSGCQKCESRFSTAIPCSQPVPEEC